MPTLSPAQLDALADVRNTAAMYLAARVGLAQEPDNARQLELAHGAAVAANGARGAAADLGVTEGQIRRAALDAQHELADRWTDSQRGAGALARAIIEAS